MAVGLDVPYFSQLDSKRDPHRVCNVTAIAMVMAFNGIVGDGSRWYLPDQVDIWLASKNLSRYVHANLDKALEWKGIQSTFTTAGTIKMAQECLDKGQPVVFSGYFSRSGHLVVFTGYDDKGFIVHDPYGEAFRGRRNPRTGWRHSHDTSKSGKNLHYSYGFILDVAGGDGKLWLHIPTGRK